MAPIAGPDTCRAESAVPTNSAIIEMRARTRCAENFGFPFNEKAAYALVNTLKTKRQEIDDELQATFPPITEERISEKTGKRLKDKVHYQKFNNMISALKKIKIDFKKEQMSNEKIILFSPASASFDDFKNFEDRGKYFNYQLRKIGINGKNKI